MAVPALVADTEMDSDGSNHSPGSQSGKQSMAQRPRWEPRKYSEDTAERGLRMERAGPCGRGQAREAEAKRGRKPGGLGGWGDGQATLTRRSIREQASPRPRPVPFGLALELCWAVLQPRHRGRWFGALQKCEPWR